VSEPVGERLELLAALAQLEPRLVERHLELPEHAAVVLDDVVDALEAVLVVPLGVRHAALEERVQHVAVQERRRRLAEGADELLQDGLARAVRRVGDLGRRDEDVGVEDEEADGARELDGRIGRRRAEVGQIDEIDDVACEEEQESAGEAA